jgi:N-sulfoglucosamine sulfohydrolase
VLSLNSSAESIAPTGPNAEARRHFRAIMRQICGGVVVCVTWFACLASAGPVRPNILLITVDDLNWDSLGVTGSPVQNISPNVDRLAREGMRFTKAHVTVAICQPSRNVLLTGRYPQNTGALGFEDITPDVPTLVEALAHAGYYTGLMAKTGHVVPSRAAAWREIVLARELKNGRSPDLYLARTRAFLARARESGQPFFLMLNSQDPHRPFAGSQQEDTFKARDAASEDAQYGGGFPAVVHSYAPSEISVPPSLPDLSEIRKELAQYYTSAKRADETTGAALRALDESGLRDRTLVVWLSDNGAALPFAKANAWLNSTRTPLIVRWPDIVKPGRVDERHLLGGVDVAPTILEAAGLSGLPGTEGRSFVPLLRGQRQSGREFVFTQIDQVNSGVSYPMRAVTGLQYGYIFNAWADGKTELRIESMVGLTFPAMREAAPVNPDIAARVRHFVYRTKEELYDYSSDPYALHNLIDDGRHQKVVAAYRQVLLRHMKKSRDPQLHAFAAFIAGNR